MTEAMKIILSTQPADARWGEKATYSINNDGITLHLNGADDLGLIQRAARKIDGLGIKHVQLSGEGWDADRCWAFWQGYKAPKGTRKVVWPDLDDAQRQELDNRLMIIDWVRDTINAPAEELGPSQLAQRAVDLISNVAGDRVTYRITKGEDLREQGYMGLHTVGRGSERSPVLLALDYNPTGDKEAPVYACLVGKGITFDSGGYSIKQTAFMDSMKSDMGGATTVTGALAFAITRGLNKRVKLFLCCADNLISGNAFKLGDIITYRNGKKVEVMNTDAEGRLVLADGLIDASAQKPELIIDAATLTGAAKTALGNDYHALFSFDDALAGRLLASASQENEPFWRLPLAEFHRSQLPSNFAELNNTGSAAYPAGASTAAGFLSHFVENYQQGWQRDDLLLEEGAVELPEGEFNAAFNPEAVVKVTDVLLASHENTAQIIDARPAARFNAEVDEPRPGLRRGHIPGALNVPWTELVREGELKTTDELDAIFFGRGVSYDKPIIVSCGSGVTAAVVLLALATLDVPNVKLYDGAWSEWGARADLPVEPVK